MRRAFSISHSLARRFTAKTKITGEFLAADAVVHNLTLLCAWTSFVFAQNEWGMMDVALQPFFFLFFSETQSKSIVRCERC